MREAMSDMKAEIVGLAERVEGPDGESLLILGIAETDALAVDLSISRREVEIAALENGVIPRRYQRSIGTLGTDGQVALLESVVAVVGLGGLGGVVCELLARIGVGKLILVDGDVYDESNLNRQIHCTEQNTSEAKAEVCRERIGQINGAIEVCYHRCILDQSNARSILEPSQAVMDCLDNVPDRFLLQKTCRALGIPLVHGAVAGGMGQVMVVPADGEGLERLYGPPDEADRHGVEQSLGNLPTTVATVAALQCQELLKITAGVGDPISDGILFLDLSSGSFNKVKLS